MKWIVKTGRASPSGELEAIEVVIEADRLRCEGGAMIFETYAQMPVPGKPGVFFEDAGSYSVVRAFPPGGWFGVSQIV